MEYKKASHLKEIIWLLSMYQALTIPQLLKWYPELTESKLLTLLNRLAKSGRLILQPEQELVLYSPECTPDTSMLAALWILLDFLPSISYHTVSEFPVVLTFYTDSDAYEVIYVPQEKELLMNHALSSSKEDDSRRLVLVDCVNQISRITFPGITAYCMVDSNGTVQYYRKQGGVNEN